MQFDENSSSLIPKDYHVTYTLSYDEKPDIQAFVIKKCNFFLFQIVIYVYSEVIFYREGCLC